MKVWIKTTKQKRETQTTRAKTSAWARNCTSTFLERPFQTRCKKIRNKRSPKTKQSSSFRKKRTLTYSKILLCLFQVPLRNPRIPSTIEAILSVEFENKSPPKSMHIFRCSFASPTPQSEQKLLGIIFSMKLFGRWIDGCGDVVCVVWHVAGTLRGRCVTVVWLLCERCVTITVEQLPYKES